MLSRTCMPRPWRRVLFYSRNSLAVKHSSSCTLFPFPTENGSCLCGRRLGVVLPIWGSSDCVRTRFCRFPLTEGSLNSSLFSTFSFLSYCQVCLDRWCISNVIGCCGSQFNKPLPLSEGNLPTYGLNSQVRWHFVGTFNPKVCRSDVVQFNLGVGPGNP